MKIPSVLSPYAGIIEGFIKLLPWIGVALLASFLFVSGCNLGESRKEDQIVKLEEDKAVLQAANASWAEAAEISNDQVEANKAQGDALLKAGGKAADRSEKEQTRTTQTIRSNQNKLEDAQSDPRCNELLRMHVCPTVPLP